MHSQYGSKAKFTGEMAEWSNAAVLKTVDCNRSGGSNPSFSAINTKNQCFTGFTPNFTPKKVKLGFLFYINILFKIFHKILIKLK